MYTMENGLTFYILRHFPCKSYNLFSENHAGHSSFLDKKILLAQK